MRLPSSVLSLLAATALAQEIEVYPEFQRPSPFGGILKADQGGRRREILSPAVVQNGYASFFLVVKLREPGSFRLDIAMNPDDRVEADLYKVWFHKLESSGEWVPDALIPVHNTFFGAVPDAENQIPGQTAAAFWLDLWVPRGRETEEERVRVEAQLSAGDRLDIYPMEVRILPVTVPDEDALDADHNSYGADWIRTAYPDAPLFDMIHAYHRIFYEHRGVFHQLGYGHAGRVAPEFAPALEGSGRRKRIANWDLYDQHYGPLLDGSAFRGTRRGPKPIRYAYLPINPEWPASFLYWDQPGYEAEFVSVVREMERHFREKGWTRTRLEMFFNHKKRYKGFPWDGDEVRFIRDDDYFKRYRELLRKAVPTDSPVRFVFRNDASWAMEKQWEDLKGVTDFWVLSQSILGFYPDAPERLKARGDTVWFYSSAVGVTEPAWASIYHPLRAWMWGADGYCLWLVTGSGPDPWFQFNGGREALVYPGTKFGKQEPIPSLRLKIERNALQDLALLKALETSLGRDRLRAEIARLTNGRRPEDWWVQPRPALADRPPDEWTNTDIAEAARPMHRVYRDLTSDWWPEIRRWIISKHMEDPDP
jgi:hypothetical protein